MTKITEARIAILATHGYERSELRKPLEQLRRQGAHVDVIAPDAGEIRSWDDKDWGDSVAVDRTLAEAKPQEYDALVLPGGQMNPDILRANETAVDFVRRFAESGKVLAAICHGPWLLVEADAVRGRNVTSWPSLRTDLRNAGANWTDEEVVTDKGIITSRKPDDLPAFISKIVEEIGEGVHDRELEPAGH